MEPVTMPLAALVLALKGWFLAHGVSIGIVAIIGIAKAVIKGEDAKEGAIDAGVTATVAIAFQVFLRKTFGIG